MQWFSGMPVLLKRFGWLLALMLFLGLLWFWLWRPPPVTGVAPQRGDAAEVVYATGEVEPRYWARVAPLVSGRLQTHCRCEGEQVSEGQVLASLDDREARATLAELEARERRAEIDYQRLKVLAARNAVSRQALDQARSEAEQTRAAVERQRTVLEYHQIRAPMDGHVLRDEGEPGEIASPDTPLFWIGRPRPLWVVAEVNEEDIPQVETGQDVLLNSDAFPGQSLEARVERITPKGDPVAKTYRVYLALPERTPLRVGMTVEANIVTRVSRHAWLLPANAFDGDRLAWVRDGRVVIESVVVGIRGIDQVEVRDGVSAETAVIVPFPDDREHGDRVRPERREAPP